MEQTTKKVEKQKETVKEKKVYTQEEAYSSSLNYFKGDELAARVWVSKYALKDSYGNIFELNPDDMHHRLASEIARIERNYANPMTEEQIFEVLRDFKYIVPQGGPMTGIGNDYQIASLSNCFVIGAVNHWLGWGVGGIASLVDIYLVLCVVWALIVITGGNLTMLNDTVMSGSLYYKVFNVFNPFV